MADGIYVSMCGAAARAEQLDAIADNLANAQTPGFKASRPAFASFLPASGADDKVYTAAVATGFDLRPGPTARTDRPLDVLPDQGAFLQVRLPDGTAGYTRDGRLSLDPSRNLVSGGRPVLDRSGNPIRIPPDQQPAIGSDGAVRVGLVTLAELSTWRLEGAVDRVAPGVLAPGQAGGSAVPAGAALGIGEIELGNAQPLDATVQLISAQRSFDASMQALQTYRRMDDRSTELGRAR